MKKYVFEYADADGAVGATWFFDAAESSVPAQTPDTGCSIYNVTITGSETDAELADLVDAKTQGANHKIMTGQMKRKEPLFPDAITASAGFTPAAALVDFQESGDPATATSNTTDTSCHVTMPTPSKAPTHGTGEQAIEVTVGQFDTGQTGTPTVRIEVWENGGGSALATSSEINVTDASQEVTFTWNADILGTADGSVVEVKVFGTASGGGPSARNATNIGPICWLALRGTDINIYISPDSVEIPAAVPAPVVTGGA